MDRLKEVVTFLPERLRGIVADRAKFVDGDITEIRLRVNCPLVFRAGCREKVFQDTIVTIQDIRQCVQFISDYSLFARQEDVKNGFITLRGGHRAGIAGQVVMDKGNIVSQKNISFINIRVAHELVGCADKVMNFVLKGDEIKNTLIISPPGCGKTTILRDIIRQLSMGINGKAYSVGVVDERSEIAACYEGVPQNDMGIRTDVLDQWTKPEGMMVLLRSMAPDVIAVDELGSFEDMKAVHHMMSCGCAVIATIHGDSPQVLEKNEIFRELGKDSGFKRLIVLGKSKGIGTVEEVVDRC